MTVHFCLTTTNPENSQHPRGSYNRIKQGFFQIDLKIIRSIEVCGFNAVQMSTSRKVQLRHMRAHTILVYECVRFHSLLLFVLERRHFTNSLWPSLFLVPRGVIFQWKNKTMTKQKNKQTNKHHGEEEIQFVRV